MSALNFFFLNMLTQRNSNTENLQACLLLMEKQKNYCFDVQIVELWFQISWL